ncbi:RNA-binding region-containing protein 3-like isoform X2 [Periplaneta americana]
MGGKSTLIIRHFPQELSNHEKEELLKHFGAVHIKSITSKIKKNSIVFARFQNEVSATAALHKLHQLDVLGHPLTVEYARGVREDDHALTDKQDVHQTKEEKKSSHKHFQAFLQKLNVWNSGVNFTQPPPAHLKYQYPPPTPAVLHNIACALASVPKFYTQVLHLMNKMNLPCPFDSAPFPEPEKIPTLVVPSDIAKETVEVMEAVGHSEEEESELESDGEGHQFQTDIIPAKRPLSHKPKKVKRPKFIKPVVATGGLPTKSVKPEEVFEKVTCEPVQRKIELKFSSAVGTDSAGEKQEEEENSQTSGGFGLMFPVIKAADEEKHSDEVEEESSKDETITAEELAANRISSRDQKHLPVFRNYQPGIPSCRLYIKNLAKQVTERDLHYIYRRYLISDSEEQGSMFDIRLMTEGRMKGQAFITLQNTKQAEVALKETNGYILKDKPLVVQFARSAKTK